MKVSGEQRKLWSSTHVISTVLQLPPSYDWHSLLHVVLKDSQHVFFSPVQLSQKKENYFYTVSVIAAADTLCLYNFNSMFIIIIIIIEFFIIYVPNQQLQGQLQTQHSVDTSNYLMAKHNIKSKTNCRETLEETIITFLHSYLFTCKLNSP
jgi:hypothetical protein